MKKILFLLILTHSVLSLPIDSNIFKYYPLKVGNVWVYNGFRYPGGGPYIYREKITSSIIINGHLYFKINETSLVRIDSTKGIILYRTTTNGCSWLFEETTGDSLAARLNDSSSIQCTLREVCLDTLNQQVFGYTKKRKTFRDEFFEGYNTRMYVMDFGIYSVYNVGHTQTDSKTLKGAVINGIVYGDTSLTGINKISSEVPETFELFQNYPNPFNPTTKIRFSLPLPSEGGAQEVKLVVYDILGKEIQTLVDEELSPGTYEVDFPASRSFGAGGDGSNLPSGVYYYRLESNNYNVTKKMVLIK